MEHLLGQLNLHSFEFLRLHTHTDTRKEAEKRTSKLAHRHARLLDKQTKVAVPRSTRAAYFRPLSFLLFLDKHYNTHTLHAGYANNRTLSQATTSTTTTTTTSSA